jgi:hypothetical protein
MKKIRLNDEQWKKLQSLPLVPLSSSRQIGGAPTLTTRLSSHGLTAADSTGQEYITTGGVLRLSQGR